MTSTSKMASTALWALAFMGAGAAQAQCVARPTRTLSTAAFGALQLPVSLDGSGRPTTISGTRLQSYSSELFERQGESRIVLRVPGKDLVTTTNSRFPRTELKEARDWRIADGCAVEVARVVVDRLPAGGDVVVGQIHQEGSVPRPPLELHYSNGTLHADVLQRNTSAAGSPRTKLMIATGIPLHQAFDYSIAVGPDGALTVTVDGQSRRMRLDDSFAASDLYFKAGNYAQSPSGDSLVAFEALGIEHTR